MLHFFKFEIKVPKANLISEKKILIQNAAGMTEVSQETNEEQAANFSLELNEDQLGIQNWVHGFAEEVIRPAAEEWDEREEFPYPIVEQAAQIGLYGWEFMAEAMWNDPTGLTMCVALEELSGVTQALEWQSWGQASLPQGSHPQAHLNR